MSGRLVPEPRALVTKARQSIMHVAFLHLSRLRGGHGLVPPRRQELVDHERLEAVGHRVAPVHLRAGSTEHVRLAFMQGRRLQDMQLHQCICAGGARFGGLELCW